MFANRYTAVIDACTLVSAPRRDLLLSLAQAEFFRIRWSEAILQETQRALEAMFLDRGMLDAIVRSEKSIAIMRDKFPAAMVDVTHLIGVDSMGLPDGDDEHVLAAAKHTQAQVIVTENLKDFPNSILQKHNLESKSADAFIADTIALDEGRAVSTIRTLRERLLRPEMSPEAYIRSLESHGLLETATLLSDHIDSI